MAAAPELIRARNVTRGVVLCDRLEWAGTSAARKTGLLGRESLPPGGGLYLVPCPWIHTFGMAFAIDVAFLSRKGRVLAIHEHLRPNRLSRLVFRAEGALELPTRTLAATGTQVGDLVCFEALDP